MYIAMVVIFILGYTAIALEHPIKINKSASALLTAVLVWVIYVIGAADILPARETFLEFINENAEMGHMTKAHQYFHFIGKHELIHHLGEISEILFFLFGAMTIVEIIDTHEGFRIITDKIKTTNKVKLLWILSFLTFFMSAALDNLTTTIVMVALLRKLVSNRQDRWIFASMVVLAANAGGAWSPIGDVTTIMLWVGGQITAAKVITNVIIPSLAAAIVPLIIVSFLHKGNVTRPEIVMETDTHLETTPFERNFIFFFGVCSLLFVPVFKTVTHLPPYLGILLGLGNLWIVTEIMHRNAVIEKRNKLSVINILRKVDTPTIFFFLGILLAVAGLQSAGHLRVAAEFLDEKLHNIYLIDLTIGILSAIVDNVPLVASAMGMYPVHTYGFINVMADPAAQEYARYFVQDGHFWEFLAYCAGTGGSVLIIGSAAGVAAMGMEKIDFIWYMKKISLLALIGYLAGAGVYYLMFAL